MLMRKGYSMREGTPMRVDGMCTAWCPGWVLVLDWRFRRGVSERFDISCRGSLRGSWMIGTVEGALGRLSVIGMVDGALVRLGVIGTVDGALVRLGVIGILAWLMSILAWLMTLAVGGAVFTAGPFWAISGISAWTRR